ncbi:DUF6082 family protein [Streptomyces sp. ActVer]|uniref:DUF6082 family protein n=1 Tax=Streptomyces sp. ActVer TaxID=3014558 RepID=UPI0022B34AE6|nr:DUF6082 family protein [Streptomyces sp. ActVer]MCZ4514130.1 DUF6082 family protein [Streptomyces sp. ActVer]
MGLRARFCTWLVAAILAIGLVGAASIVVSGWLIDGVEQANGSRGNAVERSALGGYFGAVSAIFSGIALLLLVTALLYQQLELRLQRTELALQREELAASRNELRRSAEADMRSLHVQLTQMAMADPALAAVWTTHHDEPEPTVRQHLFANLVFSHFVLARSWGSYSDADLLAHAHGLLRNPAFRHYWDSTRSARSRLSPNSPEAQLAQLFEQAVSDLRHEPPPSTP